MVRGSFMCRAGARESRTPEVEVICGPLGEDLKQKKRGGKG